MGWPSELEAWVATGGPVRRSASDLMPGRCGGELVRAAGSRGVGSEGSPYCMRGAGWGTEHPRVGRCKDHGGSRSDLAAGLPPWVGEISDSDWRSISGGRESPGLVTHGASAVARSFEDYVISMLSAEDAEVFRSVDVDPVVVIDQEVKLNRLMAWKVQRRLRELEMVAEARGDGDGRSVGGAAVAELESTLLRISGRLARLMEVRVRYSELADRRDTRDDLVAMLRGMDHEAFVALRQEPHRFSDLARFHGIPAEA